MAAVRKEDLFGGALLVGFFAFLAKKPRVVVGADSRKAREFANRVYKETGGPTPELKRLYAELLDNERRDAAEQRPAA